MIIAGVLIFAGVGLVAAGAGTGTPAMWAPGIFLVVSGFAAGLVSGD